LLYFIGIVKNINMAPEGSIYFKYNDSINKGFVLDQGKNTMPDQLKNVLITTVVVVILILLWAISIGFTYWDATSRRKLFGFETAAWMALVVLIPGIGFAAYIFARQLGRALTPDQPVLENPRRATRLKRLFEPEQRTGTIAAAEFLQRAATDASFIQTTRPSVQKGARRIKISVLVGPNTGAEYILENFPVRIGRGLDASVRLDEDYGVSRLHAEIYEQAGGLRIRDLNSTHGTKVNDTRITDMSLNPGDRIQVGLSVLMVGVQQESV
jgi:hypothetical protein